jgi:hypothetical protein
MKGRLNKVECRVCGKYITDYHMTINRVWIDKKIEELCVECAVWYFSTTSDSPYWTEYRRNHATNESKEDSVVR